MYESADEAVYEQQCYACEINESSKGKWKHSWKPSILQDAESVQNVMQDHKNLHLAELLILK